MKAAPSVRHAAAQTSHCISYVQIFFVQAIIPTGLFNCGRTHALNYYRNVLVSSHPSPAPLPPHTSTFAPNPHNITYIPHSLVHLCLAISSTGVLREAFFQALVMGAWMCTLGFFVWMRSEDLGHLDWISKEKGEGVFELLYTLRRCM